MGLFIFLNLDDTDLGFFLEFSGLLFFDFLEPMVFKTLDLFLVCVQSRIVVLAH